MRKKLPKTGHGYGNFSPLELCIVVPLMGITFVGDSIQKAGEKIANLFRKKK